MEGRGWEYSVYSSFIYDHQKLDGIKVSFKGEWIYSGMSTQWSIPKRVFLNELSNHKTTCKKFEYMLLSERSQS